MKHEGSRTPAVSPAQDPGRFDFWRCSPLSLGEASLLDDDSLDEYLGEQLTLLDKLGEEAYGRLARRWRGEYLRHYRVTPAG